MKREKLEASKTIRVERAVMIDRPAEEIFRFWREVENLPRVMKHLKKVEKLDDRRSHWSARAPANLDGEWDSEIINEVENEMIAWQSLEGSEVSSAGSVHFKPGPDGCGTEVKVILRYDPPAGVLGAKFAQLFGQHPSEQIGEGLSRLKELMETGHVSAGRTTFRKPVNPGSKPESFHGREEIPVSGDRALRLLSRRSAFRRGDSRPAPAPSPASLVPQRYPDETISG